MPPLEREVRLALAQPRIETHVPEQRRFQAVANRSTVVDSYRSMILDEAWPEDLPLFQENPIGLWMHNFGFCTEPRPPIFAPMDLEVESGVGLTFWPTFQPAGIDPFADQIYSKFTVEPRLLRAFSVGFFPLRWVNRDDMEDENSRSEVVKVEPHLELCRKLFREHLTLQRVYTRVRLDEISAVDLPANRGSLVRDAWGRVGLNQGLVRAIESLGFRRLGEEDLSEDLLGLRALSLDEAVETCEFMAGRLCEGTRSDLAEAEVRKLVDTHKKLGRLLHCEAQADPEADPEIEKLVLSYVEKVEDIRSRFRTLTEDFVGVLAAED